MKKQYFSTPFPFPLKKCHHISETENQDLVSAGTKLAKLKQLKLEVGK